MKKIGIYGGTFDPIHHGHLILARAALESLNLEKVIFVPAALSPHKLNLAPSPAEVRLAMLTAAIAAESGFEVDDCELRRAPPSYTIDTVELIRRREGDADYIYLIGTDNLTQLRAWHRFEELRLLVQFVILDRGGGEFEHRFPVVRRQIDISATDIRNRVAKGQSIRYLVPAMVEEIIRRRQLYQESEK